MIMIVPKVVIVGSGTGDKLPALIKCSSWRASKIASENQVQLLACSCGLISKPGGTAFTGALQPVASGRWGSTTCEGSSSRGRKTLISNLRCLAAFPFMGKASEVNPEEESGVEPLRQLDVDVDFLLPAPAANRVPDVLLCVPLGFSSLGSPESP